MEKIEAVIFDWGGVVIDDPRPGLLRYCAETFGVSVEHYAPAHDAFLDEFQKGLIGEDVFWQKVSRKLGRPAPKIPSLWSEAFRSAYVSRPDVFALVASLHKNGYGTALLSNTELPAIESLHRPNYAAFDALVFSCVEGLAKPDPRIYQITLERLGTEPRQSVFIDDRPDYVRGAKDAGLNAIIFEGLEQVKVQLARLGLKVN